MALRPVQVMAAGISRRTGGKIALGEVFDAIENVNKVVHTKYDWPWTRAEANILIQAPYTTGTVSINTGSASLVGTNTNWDITWKYKRLFIGQNNVDYWIKSIDSPTTATLAQPVNLSANLVDKSYTIFQDTYALPSDCEFGGILLIVNPIYRYRLRYVPTYTLEYQSVFSRVFFTNFQSGFCDAGYDDSNKAALIRFAPAPGGVSEYRLVYRRRPPSLQGLTSTPILPESFDRMIELMAEYEVRFGQHPPMPGWMETKQEAYQMLQDMRRKVASSMWDVYSAYSQYPSWENSSVYSSGLFVTPTSAP